MMIDMQLETTDVNSLQSLMQDSWLMLAEAERRETDETLRPIIAAQKAVQEARMSLLNAHVAGDSKARTAALEKISDTSSKFFDLAYDWRRAPLPEPLRNQTAAVWEKLDQMATYLKGTAEKWTKALNNGSKITLDDIREIEYNRLTMGHEIAELRYALALEIIQHRMNVNQPVLH